MPGHGGAIGVQDEVRGFGIAVTRLADAAGVDERSLAVEFDAVAGVRGQDAKRVVRPDPERRRNMGVTMEAEVGVEHGQVLEGDLGTRDVLADRVARAAVDQRHPLDLVALGEGGQPGPSRCVDRVAGPLRGGARLRVEPFDLTTADGRRVVVAPDADRPDLDQAGDDAVRIRAVADHVAEVPDGVDRSGVREYRIERHEIAVDVRQDGDPHRGRA